MVHVYCCGFVKYVDQFGNMVIMNQNHSSRLVTKFDIQCRVQLNANMYDSNK